MKMHAVCSRSKRGKQGAGGGRGAAHRLCSLGRVCTSPNLDSCILTMLCILLTKAHHKQHRGTRILIHSPRYCHPQRGRGCVPALCTRPREPGNLEARPGVAVNSFLSGLGILSSRKGMAIAGALSGLTFCAELCNPWSLSQKLIKILTVLSHYII